MDWIGIGFGQQKWRHVQLYPICKTCVILAPSLQTFKKRLKPFCSTAVFCPNYFVVPYNRRDFVVGLAAFGLNTLSIN